ncbi:MAG TPA: TonB-dependent receptor [Allosphingosinicella sp.]|nr:TonB-dependent receptor [Allosphingosinicella sp.]
MIAYRLLALPLFLCGSAAAAQRTSENAVAAADDAFGLTVGADQIGLYDAGNVRGFSPVTAGNIRVDGLSVVQHGGFTDRIVAGSVIRVGITAQNYPFPAPTGIADFSLRTAGDTPLVSAVATLGPVGNYQIEVDGQAPIVPGHLGLAAGFTDHVVGGTRGLHSNVVATGGVLRWRPADGVEVKSFYARIETYADRSAPPLYFAGGPFPPPPVPRRYEPLRWAAGRDSIAMAGTVASLRLTGHWSLKAGLFRWTENTKKAFQDLYEDVEPDGAARREMVASRDQRAASTSGEIRSTWSLDEGPRRHMLLLDARGRSTERDYGGSAVADLGTADVFRPADLPEPSLAFGPLSTDRVRQATAGLGYQLLWRGAGGLGLDVQKTDYRKETIRFPGDAPLVSRETPWLFGGNVILTPLRRLAFYGGYTNGLEEGGVAPANAVNRNAPAPAIRTSQRDAGIRYRLSDRLSFVAGLFDVRKPYVNLDPGLVYRKLGEERHRGVELSLAGRINPAFSIVGGALLMDAKVSGEAVTDRLIGPRPVGSTPLSLLLSVEWHPPSVAPMSLRLAVEDSAPAVASAQAYEALGGRQLRAPGRTSLDFGARYRFRIGGHDASVRLEGRNLLNSGRWIAGADSSFSFAGQRRLWLALAADV